MNIDMNTAKLFVLMILFGFIGVEIVSATPNQIVITDLFNTKLWEAGLRITYQQGMILQQGLTVEVDEGGYLYLEDLENNKWIVEETAGTYNYKSLSDILEKNSGFQDKFIQYVIGEVRKKPTDLTTYHQQYMAQHLGVTRGRKCNMLVSPVDGGTIMNGEISFNWKRSSSSYVFKIYEEDNEIPVFSKTIQDTFINLSSAALNMHEGSTYLWAVNENGICDKPKFILATLDNLKNLNLSLDSIVKDKDTSGILFAIKKASIYEEWDFIEVAKKIYSKAALNAPNSLIAKQSYLLFLARTGVSY